MKFREVGNVLSPTLRESFWEVGWASAFRVNKGAAAEFCSGKKEALSQPWEDSDTEK